MNNANDLNAFLGEACLYCHHLKRPNIRIRALDSLRTQPLTAQLAVAYYL